MGRDELVEQMGLAAVDIGGGAFMALAMCLTWEMPMVPFVFAVAGLFPAVRGIRRLIKIRPYLF